MVVIPKTIYEDSGLIIESISTSDHPTVISLFLMDKSNVVLTKDKVKKINNILSRWLVENQS